jgi:hypothetical protein
LQQQAANLEQLRLELDRIVNSNSWKLTRPIRVATVVIKRLFEKKVDMPLEPNAGSTDEDRN